MLFSASEPLSLPLPRPHFCHSLFDCSSFSQYFTAATGCRRSSPERSTNNMASKQGQRFQSTQTWSSVTRTFSEKSPWTYAGDVQWLQCLIDGITQVCLSDARTEQLNWGLEGSLFCMPAFRAKSNFELAFSISCRNEHWTLKIARSFSRESWTLNARCCVTQFLLVFKTFTGHWAYMAEWFIRWVVWWLQYQSTDGANSWVDVWVTTTCLWICKR